MKTHHVKKNQLKNMMLKTVFTQTNINESFGANENQWLMKIIS
jgi:hypothetical protein